MATVAVVLIHFYKKVYFFTDVQMFVVAENLGTFLLEIGKYYDILSLGITYRAWLCFQKNGYKKVHLFIAYFASFEARCSRKRL